MMKSVFERYPCQASTGLPFDFSIYVLPVERGVAETRCGEVAGFSALASFSCQFFEKRPFTATLTHTAIL